jgi:hypothetical protein
MANHATRRRCKNEDDRTWLGFAGSNIGKGMLSAVGTLLVYALVAWLVIRYGWDSLKSALQLRAMAVQAPPSPPPPST